MPRHTSSPEVRHLSELWYRMSSMIRNYDSYTKAMYPDYVIKRPSLKRCTQTRNRHYRHITGRTARSLRGKD